MSDTYCQFNTNPQIHAYIEPPQRLFVGQLTRADGAAVAQCVALESRGQTPRQIDAEDAGMSCHVLVCVLGAFLPN